MKVEQLVQAARCIENDAEEFVIIAKGKGDARPRIVSDGSIPEKINLLNYASDHFQKRLYEINNNKS